jgi:hypothetical protein
MTRAPAAGARPAPPRIGRARLTFARTVPGTTVIQATYALRQETPP